MIKAFRINSAKNLCMEILHVLVSSIGISSAAIPDDATAKALLVLPVDLLFAEIVL